MVRPNAFFLHFIQNIKEIEWFPYVKMINVEDGVVIKGYAEGRFTKSMAEREAVDQELRSIDEVKC